MISSTSSAFNLTVNNAASGSYALTVMTVVAAVFFPVVLIYQGWSFYVFRARVKAPPEQAEQASASVTSAAFVIRRVMTDEALQTVRLHDEGASLEATFVPAAGMLCCSLRHRGKELLAQNAGVAAYAQQGKTMGIPLLYPWANRLADFDYSIDGRTVVVPHDATRVALDDNGLPIHGVIGGRLEWELIKAPGPDARSVLARLRWSEAKPELFEVFPFRHDLLYEAHLADGRLEIQVTVRACGEDVVPVAFGFHPYLSLPGVARERWLVRLPPMRHLALDVHQIPVGPEQTLPDERFELAEQHFDDGFDVVADPACFEELPTAIVA